MSSGEAPGFSALAVDHARNPRNRGRLAEFDGHAGVTGSCGDSMDMWIRVEDGFVVDVGFHTDGCGSSVACGSMAAELARSRHLAAVPLLRPRDVLDAFGEFPEESAHCADLAIDALRAACDDYFRAAPSRTAIRILVLSGNGGTGKSTLVVSLARNFATRGFAVGILDADLDCPAIPDMLGATESDIDGSGIPMGVRDGIRFCSIGPLSRPGRPPLLLRGARRSLLARRMVREVDWGPLDLMLIDTAPGTGDEIQAVARSAGRIHGAILVGRNDSASERGVLRSAAMCAELDVPLLGVVGNLAGSERAPILGRIATSLETAYFDDFPQDPAANPPSSGLLSAIATLVERNPVQGLDIPPRML